MIRRLRRLLFLSLVVATTLSACDTGATQEPSSEMIRLQALVQFTACQTHFQTLSESQKAVQNCHDALSLYRELGDQRMEALTLLYLGVVHYDLTHYQKALSFLNQSLLTWEETGEQDGKATTLLALGMTYDAVADYEQALHNYEEALKIQVKVDDRYGMAMTSTRIGWLIYHHRSDYKKSLDYLHDALAYYEQGRTLWEVIGDWTESDINSGEHGGDSVATPEIPDAIETACSDMTDVEQIEDCARQVVDYLFTEPISDSESYAQTYPQSEGAKAGDVMRKLFYYESDAERTLLNLRQVQTHHRLGLVSRRMVGGSAEEADTLSTLGMIYRDLSDYEQALVCFQRSLEIYRDMDDRADEAATLYNIGTVYQALSDHENMRVYYQQAVQHYEQTLEWYQSTMHVFQAMYPYSGLEDDPMAEPTMLNITGMLHHDLGNYDESMDRFQQALVLFREIGNKQSELDALNNAAAVYRDVGDFRMALVSYEEALVLARDIGAQAVETGCLHSVGMIYRELDEHETAIAHVQQALSIHREIGDRVGEALALKEIGTIYYDLAEYEKALDYVERALAIESDIGVLAQQLTSRSIISSIYESQGMQEQALQSVIGAVDILESAHGEFKAETMKSAFAATVSEYYRDAVRLLLAQGLETDAFEYAERGRARTFLTLLGNRRVDSKSSEDPKLVKREAQLRDELINLEHVLQREWDKPKDKRMPWVITSTQRDLEVRRQEYAELLLQLQHSNPEYTDLVRVDSLSVEDVQFLLKEYAPNTTLLMYFVGEVELTIFVLNSESFHVQTVSVTRHQLRQQVEELLAEMKTDTLLPSGWQPPAAQLHSWLIAPVQNWLPASTLEHPARLGIISHDVLHYLPFSILFDGEHTLLDTYALFYAPNTSSLQFIFEKRKPNTTSLVAFANPDAAAQSHLHYAVEETEAVAALYGVQPFIGSDASEGLFKTEAGNHGIVHVAAHSRVVAQ